MRLYLLVITLVPFFYCCSQVHKSSIGSADTATHAIQRVDSTSPFSHYYTYDSTRFFNQNIFDGWIDTFSIANQRFRLLSDSDGGVYIEKSVNGTWKLNIPVQIYAKWDASLSDVNGDSYPDMCAGYSTGAEINFYNPVLNLFDTITWDMHYNDSLLDKTQNLHYNNWVDNIRPLTSDLYTFKGTRPYYYYVIMYDWAKYQGKNDKYVTVWKYRNGDNDMTKANLIKKIRVSDEDEGMGFDCGDYWRKHYRDLLAKYIP